MPELAVSGGRRMPDSLPVCRPSGHPLWKTCDLPVLKAGRGHVPRDLRRHPSSATTGCAGSVPPPRVADTIAVACPPVPDTIRAPAAGG